MYTHIHAGGCEEVEECDKAQKENVKCKKLKRGKCEGGLSGDELSDLGGEHERSEPGSCLSRLAREGDSKHGNT